MNPIQLNAQCFPPLPVAVCQCGSELPIGGGVQVRARGRVLEKTVSKIPLPWETPLSPSKILFEGAVRILRSKCPTLAFASFGWGLELCRFGLESQLLLFDLGQLTCPL